MGTLLLKKCAYINAKDEAVHMILSEIRDEIYSTVDACTTAKEMWIAIERLQQCESLNKQDVKTNLFWKFGKFTSRDGGSIESSIKVNDIRGEKISRNANPLALVVALNRFGHFARECRKPKLAKDYTYYKEKMMLNKPEEKDSRPTYDVELLEQVQSNDDYNVFATERQHSEQPESINDTYVVETVDSNVIPNSSDMCDNEEKADQNAEEYDDERVVLANLIENLKLDTDENKKIQKQLKKANTSLTHELNECKYALEESNDI
ncbi:hypothetical protein Tco_0566669 [Tanacetum coccineum]